MNDSLSVGRIQSIRDLDDQIQKSIRFEGLALNDVLECVALEQLHGDEGLAFILVDFINRADVGVIQAGSSLRLTLKSLQRLMVL